MNVGVTAADEDEVLDDRRDTHDSDLRFAPAAMSSTPTLGGAPERRSMELLGAWPASVHEESAFRPADH
jgi:hypothetical protein